MCQPGRILRMYQDKLMIEQRAMVFSVLNLSTVTNIKRDTQSFQSVSLQMILLLLGYHIEMNLLTPDVYRSYKCCSLLR